MTGIEGTKQECDNVLLLIHGALLVHQSTTYIEYVNAECYGKTIKHPTEERYFAPIKKEKVPAWEAIIDTILTTEQLAKYGQIPGDFYE